MRVRATRVCSPNHSRAASSTMDSSKAILFPFRADAVQPLREAALLGESRRLSFDLSVQKRTGHTDEHQRGIRRDPGVGWTGWTAWRS